MLLERVLERCRPKGMSGHVASVEAASRWTDSRKFSAPACLALDVPKVRRVLEDQQRASGGYRSLRIGDADAHQEPRQDFHACGGSQSERLRPWLHPENPHILGVASRPHLDRGFFGLGFCAPEHDFSRANVIVGARRENRLSFGDRQG
jgi:hypothetical protein